MKSFIPIVLLAAAAVPAHAQGWIEPERPMPDFAVEKVRTVVSVEITGRIARVEVEEWFRNRGGALGEGDYLYPLPGEAVFSNFSLFQGDMELRGETMDARQARSIYEEIVRRKRDPALIELAGHGLIRARVFPIEPGDTRKITLRYTQVLGRAGDALQFRYAAGGRTGPADPHPRAEGQPGLRRGHANAPVTFVLRADGADLFGEPFSPTHDVETTRRDGQLTVRPASSFTGDFQLFLPFAREAVGLTIVTHRPVGEDGYFMLTVSPGAADGPVEARDITAVVDISGSMSGQKIVQARAALQQLLHTLGREDRFRLIAFSNRVRAQSRSWTDVTPASMRAASEWIEGLRANGGTHIAGALEEAFRLSSPAERLPIVLFLTDGLPSVGEQNPERIAEMAERSRGRARVFSFGVGYDVNTYLLDRLATAGRGTTEYVEPHEDVEQALGLLTAKIQHPVLTDLALSGPVRFSEIYPGALPDLFAGDELVIFGRYARAGTGDLAVTGRRGGETERYTTRSAFPDHEDANDFVAQLWAARKIGVLQQQVRLHGANDELIAEIRETALRYGLLSEYTSYLVQEPEAVAQERTRAPGRRDLAAPMPAAAPVDRAMASGAGAVASAKADQARREVRTVADLNEVDEDMLVRGHFPQAQHVAGRVFVEQHGVWTDLHHGDSLTVVAIEAYSPAYFALLERAPELRAVFARFERVIVAGREVSIQVGPRGRSDAAGMGDLVRRFRAR